MSESKKHDSVTLTSPIILIDPRLKSSLWFINWLFLVAFLMVANSQVQPLHGQFFPWELVGLAALHGPEDVAYHSRSGLIYTGCTDGWIKRVTVTESSMDTVVKKWVDTGGRPVGIAFGRHDEVIVADPEKGLLNISRGGEVKVLSNGTNDQKFKLIDSVVVAEDGMVYFTEASYKYNLEDFLLDIMEGKPHGRLWSYDPTTKKTKVLLRNLYFANGLAVSPNQNSVVFCETVKMRCRKYYIRGKKKGSVKDFIDLLGFPDNIHYDGEGHYWIALSLVSSSSNSSELAHRYSLARKGLGMMVMRSNGQPVHDEEDESNSGGVLVVDTEGKPTSQYYGPELSLISSGVKIGNFVYCGSLFNPYMVRLHLNNFQNYSSLV